MSLSLQHHKKFKIAVMATTLLVNMSFANAKTIKPKTPAATIEEFATRAAPITGWDKAEIIQLLKQAEVKPRILELMDKPGEAMPWDKYKERVVTKTRVENGILFMAKYADALSKAEQAYGVPKEIITAIIGVETSYGANKGGFRVVDALTTLSFHYPRRATFFQNELMDFLVLSNQAHIDPNTITGSYAGAIGWPQFMPSSAKKLAVDFDGDGRIDLVESPVDAIGSIGSYFRANGWKTGSDVITMLPTDAGSNLEMPITEGQKEYYKVEFNFEVIKRYNRSNLYALSVALLGKYLKESQPQN